MPNDKSDVDKDKARGSARRPFATLDLKATEIKVTPISGRSASVDLDAGAKVPGPLPARFYMADRAGLLRRVNEPRVEGNTGTARQAIEHGSGVAAMSDSAPRSSTAGSTTGSAGTTAAGQQASAPPPRKGGGFFGYLAAGIAGSVVAIAAAVWGLPQLGISLPEAQVSVDAAAIAQRLQALEKSATENTPGQSSDIADLARRLDELERTAKTIPALKESQSKLVADTKAALAGAASDAGAPELITRLAAVEQQMKAMADAGANDPNAGRVEQIAALTGKVADLETSLATQLTELRKSVTEDVESRLVATSAASEAAKSGTQRIDRDLASIKTDTVRLEERLAALQNENDRLAAALKLAEESNSALKNRIDQLATTSAKSSDIAAAIAPITGSLSAIEQDVRMVQKAEDSRRANAERVVVALELQNLKRALERGARFDSELAAVQASAGGKLDLAALEKVKEGGVPTLPGLEKEFRTAANAAIDADQEPVDGGVVDKLWAGAKSVVRVRRTDLKTDDKSTEAIVGRMQTALNEGRLSELLTEADSLPPKAKEAARPFLDKVAARVSVDNAVASIEKQLKASFASGDVNPAP